jgi:tetratricopeptide (TPR) repeat protein
MFAGRLTAALTEVTHGIRLLDGVPEHDGRRALMADLLTTRSFAFSRQDRHVLAYRTALEAEREARAAGSPAQLATALNSIEEALLAMGRPAGGTYMREALDILEGSDELELEAITKGNLGMLAFYTGDWAEAESVYRSSSTAFRRLGDMTRAALTDTNLAEMLIMQRKYEMARPLLEDAIRVFRATGSSLQDFAETLAARVAVADGDTVAAANLAGKVTGRTRQRGAPSETMLAEVVAAEAAIVLGEPDRALSDLDAAAEASRGEWVLIRPWVEQTRAAALVDLGRRDEAVVRLQSGLTAATEAGLAYEAASLTSDLQALGSFDVATAQDAEKRLRALGVLVDEPTVIERGRRRQASSRAAAESA